MPAFHAFEPAARIIVATLFNSLWEGAILALIIWAILRFATNINATTRYALWISALVAVIVLPIVTTVPFVTTVSHHAQAPQTQPAAGGGESHPIVAHSQSVAAAHTAATRSTAAPVNASTPAVHLQRFRFNVPAVVAVSLFGLWALIALALLARVLVGLVRLERLKSDSLPLPLEYREHLARWANAQKGGRDVRLCVSDKIEVPVAVGLFDAMILIPKHLLDSLSQEEIDQITLHELAHLRRGDDWTNGLQRVIQSLFFFNPAILWMAQQLDLEREVACDDWVLLQTNEVRPYAFCLTKMAEVTAWPHRAIAAPGVFVTRKSLSIRVERLLRAGRDIRTSVTFAPATIVGATVIVLFFVLQTVAPSFAFAEDDTTVVTTEPSTTQPGKQDVTVVHH
ncbi:MAG: M56 family metallopeptidase, partial [Candidatus Eremiobacteraeota bacterium]|nr:M56 family metallopeptidase [Candidatus Eremiobacteraeota bacterium]